ncbi:MAG: hypothetical protein J5511_05470 [Bacilli bacterium]|nr:hypothetical protein [Bacilli bacterium]
MQRVVGERYISPRIAVIIGLAFLFLVFIGIGIYISVKVHEVYLIELDTYELELLNYQYGYSYTKPSEPIEPIWKYFLYNGAAVIVGLIVCGLLFRAYGYEKQTEQNVIIFDDKKRQILIYKDFSYCSIPIKSIIKMERLIVPGGVYTGKVFIPTLHPTNSIVFKYEKDGKKSTITSEPVKEPDNVIITIEMLRDSIKKQDKKDDQHLKQ